MGVAYATKGRRADLQPRVRIETARGFSFSPGVVSKTPAGGDRTTPTERDKGGNDMYRADRRSQKRFRSRYGHFGIGATHIREASEAEVRRHVEKAELRSSKRRRK